MPRKYVNLESDVCQLIGARASFEPSLTWKPDFITCDREIVVGEIKDKKEVLRVGSSWAAWSNPKTHFGGKRKGDTLTTLEDVWKQDVDEYAAGVNVKRVRDFVATIMGQLKNAYAKPIGSDSGWLIVEKDEDWRDEDLDAALGFLKKEKKVTLLEEKSTGKLVAVKVRFI